jgi:hypothetical protein
MSLRDNKCAQKVQCSYAKASGAALSLTAYLFGRSLRCCLPTRKRTSPLSGNNTTGQGMPSEARSGESYTRRLAILSRYAATMTLAVAWTLAVCQCGLGDKAPRSLDTKGVSAVQDGEILPFVRGKFVRVEPAGLQMHAAAFTEGRNTSVLLQIGNVSGHAVMIDLRKCSLIATKAERLPRRWSSGIPNAAIGQPAWLLFGDYRVVQGVPARTDPSQAREDGIPSRASKPPGTADLPPYLEPVRDRRDREDRVHIRASNPPGHAVSSPEEPAIVTIPPGQVATIDTCYRLYFPIDVEYHLMVRQEGSDAVHHYINYLCRDE